MVGGRRSLLGRRVTDWQGRPVGVVVDTWPFDGGGEPELAVLRLGRLGERRMLPVGTLHVEGGELRTPYARWQVEDSPALEEGRHAADACERAMSYWMWEEPVVSLPPRWGSSGSSASAWRFRTTPGRTTTGS
jgi:hypothetical protein